MTLSTRIVRTTRRLVVAVTVVMTLTAAAVFTTAPVLAQEFNCVNVLRADTYWSSHWDAFAGVPYARDFADHARAAGYPVDRTPVVGGALVMLPGSRNGDTYAAGHVAQIVSVISSTRVVIVEENYGRTNAQKARQQRVVTIDNRMWIVHHKAEAPSPRPAPTASGRAVFRTTAALNVRSGPGSSYARVGGVGANVAVRVVCQQANPLSPVGGSVIFDRIDSPISGWITDAYVATGTTGFARGVARC